jgi:hypothetical protein
VQAADPIKKAELQQQEELVQRDNADSPDKPRLYFYRRRKEQAGSLA